MSDHVKIYDSVCGTEWLAGRGYGTVSGASMSKKQSGSGNSWSSVFTTWKKKGKLSVDKKKSCRDAFSPSFAAVTSSSLVMNPLNVDPHPAILKFCSLSAASGHHYLSNGNYKFSRSSGSPAGDGRCQQVPCMSVRGASCSSSPASISQSSAGCGCCSQTVSGGRRGSLFAAEWDTHPSHTLRCTCHHHHHHPHANPQSARPSPARTPVSSFTSRYTPPTGRSPLSSGITDVHGTSDQQETQAALHSVFSSPDRLASHLTSSPPLPPANNKNSSSSASPASHTPFYNKKSGKHSSTISGSFVRSLRRSTSREPFNSVSGRKSILNNEVSAYDLIRHEFDQEEESDNESFVPDFLSRDAVNMRSTPRHETAAVGDKNGRRSRRGAPASAASKVKSSEYLSKNMRIGGQGVTLFSWEESLHKQSPSSAATDKRHHSENGCSEAGIPAVIPEEEEEAEDSVSCENIPEPDYDLSDEDDALLKSLNSSATATERTAAAMGSSIQQQHEALPSPHRKSLTSTQAKHDLQSDYEIASEKHVTRSILKRPQERSEHDAKNCTDRGAQSVNRNITGSGSMDPGRYERTKYRKSALNCMIKLKLNKRNHRKHVTFRSYKDESMILEHINEPIPEEDETLYDDVASDPSDEDEGEEEQDIELQHHKNSIQIERNGLSSENVIQSQVSGETHSDEAPEMPDHRELPAGSQENGSQADDELMITGSTSDCEARGREKGKVYPEERSDETNADAENDSQTSYVDLASEPERGTAGKQHQQQQQQEQQLLDQISEEEEAEEEVVEEEEGECDNGNEYYDHFPDESSQKHAFTIAFYNSLGLQQQQRLEDHEDDDDHDDDCDRVHGEDVPEQEGFDAAKPAPAPRRMSLASVSPHFQPLYKSHANSTSKSNKIIIDVPAAGDYESLGHLTHHEDDEHIYEELVTQDEDSLTHRSMFDGASKDEILEYLEDAKERVKILITSDRSIYGVSDSYPSVDPEPSDQVRDHPHQIIVHETSLTEGGKILPSSSSSSATSSSSSSSGGGNSNNNRRNRSSNVSNSSTDSAVTTGSSIDDEALISGPAILRSVSLSQLVERNDSGVGTETSKPAKLRRSVSGETEQRCTDCDQVIDVTEEEVSSFLFFPATCTLCDKKRSERKEIISEFVDTELKYGRDLRVIKEEFYRPMEVAGLMTKEQLKAVFINLDELILVNSRFSEKLEDALEIACEQGDEEYTSINLGRLFQESSGTMLHAFETYCSRQGTASLILTQLEKEKELLRIFLRVSQMENTLLRRMNLSAFLMVPVQRVTKYPLLLNRLHKVTPVHHQDREALRAAQQKVELHLEHINQQTKATPNKIWKRISNLSVSQRRLAIADNNSNIKLRKIALDALHWDREEAQFALCGRLTYACISESHCSSKARGKTSKFLPVHALLVTLGRPTSFYRPDLVNTDSEHELTSSMNKSGIRDAALVLIREKNGRFTMCRDPFDMKGCIVSTESEEEAFEVQELLAKESYMFKAELNGLTCQWFKQLSYHSRDLGGWRKRRNALANIMMGCR